jgi:hypothetical protein
MGIAWGNTENEHMGLKHNCQNFACYSDDMFQGLSYSCHMHEKLQEKKLSRRHNNENKS